MSKKVRLSSREQQDGVPRMGYQTGGAKKQGPPAGGAAFFATATRRERASEQPAEGGLEACRSKDLSCVAEAARRDYVRLSSREQQDGVPRMGYQTGGAKKQGPPAGGAAFFATATRRERASEQPAEGGLEACRSKDLSCVAEAARRDYVRLSSREQQDSVPRVGYQTGGEGTSETGDGLRPAGRVQAANLPQVGSWAGAKKHCDPQGASMRATGQSVARSSSEGPPALRPQARTASNPPEAGSKLVGEQSRRSVSGTSCKECGENLHPCERCPSAEICGSPKKCSRWRTWFARRWQEIRAYYAAL